MSAGYSGTPLVRKLGLKDGMRVRLVAVPKTIRDEMRAAGVALDDSAAPPLDAVLIFSREADDLRRRLTTARADIAPNGMIWVGWPKRSSKVPTDITEDTIRSLALPMGLVDIKVCAVDAVWSGLKLVIRRDLRDRQR